MNIFLYVPNLIGYARFACTFVCVKYAFDPRDEAWIKFVVLYSISQLLDAFDGFAARKLNQCSRFGAALDMISDRTSCATIYMILMCLYKETLYSYYWFFCFVLDFGAHYLQFISSALVKSESHKGKNDKENFIVSYYYNNKVFFMTLVTLSEVCSVFMVLMKRSETLRSYSAAWVVAAFLMLNLSTKMFINIY